MTDNESMNKFAYLIIFVSLLSGRAARAEHPYETLDQSYRQRGESIEITPMTPVKSQDGIGLCYGFTATSLLENYRCREMNLDCNDPKEILSSLDVTSYYQRERLVEGGQTYRILSNLESGKKKVAREECARFSTLVHQVSVSQNSYIKDEKRGWNFLTKKWNEYRGLAGTKRNDCVSCLADEIKSTLVNITTPTEQLKKAFEEARSLEEFLYKSILPVHCLEESKMAAIPPFVTKSFPTYKDKLTDEALAQKIETVLRNNIPLEMGICTSGTNPCQNDSGHSITLFGIKEMCNGQSDQCRKVVKIKNSYGMSWQNNTDDGWVDLAALTEASRALGPHNNITWIQKPGQVLVEKKTTPPQTPRPVTPSRPGGGSGIPTHYKDYKGIWKCPNATFRDYYEPGCVPMGR